ncbi:DUF7522 family protein [Halorussus amylolyticus]|uniref:DUF7522 family protein n=1 Tax=Halorussus amylolyticus TaxID=1126242 RepID=UPI00192F5AFF|nr:hypothetical protein [Halorussus amylolyticus]
MCADTGAQGGDGKDALLRTLTAFGSDALRDVWLFDQSDHESMYLRDDVERKIADLNVAKYVDNERYGYVTRDTYADLHYTSYEYTVRGFDGYEQFRTFLSNDAQRIGVFASFDRREGGYDFGTLYDDLMDVVADHHIDSFRPE